MKILSQCGQGWKGYHGTVGDPTKMFDSFGNPLFVGDIVVLSYKDAYWINNGYPDTQYGIEFVVEEDTSIANWTGKDMKFVNGLFSVWNEGVFEDNMLDKSFFKTEAYQDKLYKIMGGWIVEKVKSFYELVNNENMGLIYVQELEER